VLEITDAQSRVREHYCATCEEIIIGAPR
jgi:hypothetical protein